MGCQFDNDNMRIYETITTLIYKFDTTMISYIVTMRFFGKNIMYIHYDVVVTTGCRKNAKFECLGNKLGAPP